MLSALVCTAVNNNSTHVTPDNKISVTDFKNFKLHTYVSGDALGNISHIIEGANSLDVIEPAAFHANIKELGDYIQSLKKPVERVLANYHAAGFSAFDASKFVMIAGMPEYVNTENYQGMLAHFASLFGDAFDKTPVPANVTTIPRNTQVLWAGIPLKFTPGSTSDYPASSILIGGKVYYIHFTPAANAHIGATELTNREAVNACLAELKKAKKSGATTFIGSHGGGNGDIAAVNFQIAYLKKVNSLLKKEATAENFIRAMKAAYPGIGGEAELEKVADALYK